MSIYIYICIYIYYMLAAAVEQLLHQAHCLRIHAARTCMHIKEEVREDLYMQAGLQVSSILLYVGNY
jgi:hypothetical protein